MEQQNKSDTGQIFWGVAWLSNWILLIHSDLDGMAIWKIATILTAWYVSGALFAYYSLKGAEQ